MKNKIFFVLIIFFSAFVCWPNTILIDTKSEYPDNQMQIDRRKAIVSMENGVMDVLFESGFVFFNTYETQKNSSEMISIAGDKGAEYLLILVPGEKLLKWEVFNVRTGGSLGSNSLDLTITEEIADSAGKWNKLGTMAGKEAVEKINNG
jgi:hypothetical protein